MPAASIPHLFHAQQGLAQRQADIDQDAGITGLQIETVTLAAARQRTDFHTGSRNFRLMVRRQIMPTITEELQQVIVKHRDAVDALWTSGIYTLKRAPVSRFIVAKRRAIHQISEISAPVISTSGHPS